MNLLVIEVEVDCFSQHARKNMDVEIQGLWKMHLVSFLFCSFSQRISCILFFSINKILVQEIHGDKLTMEANNCYRKWLYVINY